MKEPEVTQDYRTIDGNYARTVIGYCQYHRGYVTSKQARTHRCHLKHGGVCPRLQDMEGRHIRKVKTEVFYDKMLDRMDKMITAMNKLTRTLEAMEKNNKLPPLVPCDERVLLNEHVHLEAKSSDDSYGNITIE